MSTITAERLARIKRIILARALQDYPEARFITETQIVLDAGAGAVMNLDNLLGVIAGNDEQVEGEIIDDYLKHMDGLLAVGRKGEPTLDRRSILGSVTKMIYPAGAMPEYVEPIPLTDSLEYVYALHDNDMAMAQPLSKLTRYVDREILDLTAHAKLKAYARGVSVFREMGGVLLTGRKQTPSIAFCIDACAKMLKLPKSQDGWLVAMPKRSMMIIIPANNVGMFVPLVELSTSIHVQAPDPLSPWVYYVRDGAFHEVLGPSGVDVPPGLAALHGDFEEWPVEEGYWEGNYAEGV